MIRWSLVSACAILLAACPGADKPPPQSPKSPEQMPPGATTGTAPTTPSMTGTQPPVTGTPPTGTTPEPGTPAGTQPPELPKTVKLKLVAVPKAKVRWGKKTLGVTPLSFERPRDSGPVDLVFLASGYFPVHTRAFTYKSDSLYISMTKLADRAKLYGAKKEPPPAAPCDPAAGPCVPAPTGTTPGVPVPSMPVAPGTPPLPLPPVPTTKPAPAPAPAPPPAP